MKHGIILGVRNWYNQLFKSKVSKIIVTTLFSFSFGVIFTAVIVLSYNGIKKTVAEGRGIGGYESSSSSVGVEDELASMLSESNLEDGVLTGVSVKDENAPETIAMAENLAADELYVLEPAVLTYQTYRVKKGDMIGFIADDYGVTQDTIISINNIKQSRLIQPGQYLKIPSMPGILYTVKANGETPATIAKKYDIDAEKCALVNSVPLETSFSAGSSVFVPDAVLDWATRQEINGDLFHNPLHSRYWLSSPYGWRDSPFSTGKRSFHSGMDMATAAGTPIYAALDGIVSAAGYNATYGNYVIITHHSGYKSLYGHMSKITCKKGNFVYTKTKIGEVGSTGLSTGPHLHFTVYKNGKTVNPSTLFN
ncbi:MAG: M23 family metallopeptidase [Treponema sp.]|nr:M23 family metallopeptidase [Treponema sp.]